MRGLVESDYGVVGEGFVLLVLGVGLRGEEGVTHCVTI